MSGASAAPKPGMGAIPHAQGTSFRVWAPHAEHVFVVGDFNDWSSDLHPLQREENGYWSVDIAQAKPGHTYKYRIRTGELDLMRVDPYAREVTNSIGNGVIHEPAFGWEDQGFQMPPWNELAIYEMHIGTFHAATATERGTFDSAIEKLAYLQEIGFNAITVMPPMEFAGDVSWGYNPSHPFAIESSYGGPMAFKRFVQAAHQHGIAIILDVVYNHFGPSDLDLWQFDGWNEHGMGGIYFYNDWRANTPWGDTRPDYGRHEVRQYLVDNALMWLEEYHVDGLRFDATAFIRSTKGDENPAEALSEGWDVLRWINDEIDKRQPWKLTIAEDLRNNATLTMPTTAGGAGFDAQWDGGFVHPLREALITTDDVERNIGAVAAALTNTYGENAFARVVYTESHDEVANGKARVPQEIAPDDTDGYFAKKRSILGAALVFSAPGIPMLFQGQEFLQDGWFIDSQPLDWARSEQFGGIRQLYHDLLVLRRNGSGVSRGLSGHHIHLYHMSLEAKVLAFHRWEAGGPHDSVIVVANFTHQPLHEYQIGMPFEGIWQTIFNSDSQLYDPAFHNTDCPAALATAKPLHDLPFSATIHIGPYSVVMFSQQL
jgi:1,4-alpha-glucan branching enzyme